MSFPPLASLVDNCATDYQGDVRDSNCDRINIDIVDNMADNISNTNNDSDNTINSNNNSDSKTNNINMIQTISEAADALLASGELPPFSLAQNICDRARYFMNREPHVLEFCVASDEQVGGQICDVCEHIKRDREATYCETGDGKAQESLPANGGIIKTVRELVIVGDLLGQFEDMRLIFATHGMPSPSRPFVFLGNIVHGKEGAKRAVLLLLALKAIR